MLLENLDFSSLHESESAQVKAAISIGNEFIGYIDSAKTFQFVLKNYRRLAEMGGLERNWVPAYLHASNFEAVPLSELQDVFDACNRDTLQEQFPIYVGDHFSNGERFSLFRGCAGPQHRKGMSWTSSLDKAIWYAAHHAKYYGLQDVAVYATVVSRSEIYCCGDRYDFDYIVHPQTWWKVDVPASEFRLDRQR
jgi:hypothetical protein